MALAIHLPEAAQQLYAPSPAARKLHAKPYETSEGQPHALGEGLRMLDYKARLDNREALAVMLGIAASDAADWPADDLLLRAYRQWGRDMPKHLRGDWWFALWDGQQRRLVLAIDPTSPTPLFYAQTADGRFVFSPSLRDVLHVPGIVAAPCEKRIVSYLLYWVNYPDYEQTEYEGIRQVRPGSCLILDGQGVRCESYWDPRAIARLSLPSDQEYVEEFLRLYRKAVAVRIAGQRRVGTMLSAGLDSGSVTALAAEKMVMRQARLPAFTHVPVPEAQDIRMPGKLVDEWSLAHGVARRFDCIEHIAIQSAEVSPLEAWQRGLELTGRWQSTGVNAPWIHHLHAEVQRRQLDTLLCGQLGNIVVSWAGVPAAWWSQVVQGKWCDAAGTLLAGRPVTPYNIGRGVAGALWRSVRPARPLGPQRIADLPSHPVNAGMLDRYRRVFEEEAAGASMRDVRTYRDHQLPMLVMATSINALLASTYGLDISDPTADQDLIEFCLATPNDQFARAGQDRWLMRRAMQGILSPEVQWNRVRGDQAADAMCRLVAWRDQVEALLSYMAQSGMAQHYLDMPALRQRWKQSQTALICGADFFALQTGLAAGMFFAKLEGAGPL